MDIPSIATGIIIGASLLFLGKKLTQLEAYLASLIMLKKITRTVINAIGGSYFTSANNAQIKVTIYMPVEMLDQKTGDLVAKRAYLGAVEYVKENLPGWIEGAKTE